MKFIPYEKLQKEKQKALNQKKRCSFGSINPVTQKIENKKIYQRKRARMRDHEGSFYCNLTNYIINTPISSNELSNTIR